MNTQDTYNYNQCFEMETRGMSKKEKKTFIKCVNYEKSKNPTRDRLRKKLEEKRKLDW